MLWKMQYLEEKECLAQEEEDRKQREAVYACAEAKKRRHWIEVHVRKQKRNNEDNNRGGLYGPNNLCPKCIRHGIDCTPGYMEKE